MTPLPNPYAAPVAQPAPIARSGRRKALLRSCACFGLSLGMGVLATVLSSTFSSRVVGAVLVVATLIAAVGAGYAGATVVRTISAPGPRAADLVAGLSLFALHGTMVLFGALLALISSSGGRGRQLRRFGRVLLPKLRHGDEWSHAASAIPVDASVREPLAAQWRENARTEHASVAAFARLTLDLVVLGAPPELLASAQADGKDEIRHAEMCLSLAAAIDGRHESPAPFPEARSARTLPRPRGLALATLAVDSLVDGALHEGVSARIIARLAHLAEPPEIRRTLAQLAADEGRHAANGWHVVEWCVREGGERVVSALEGAARVLPAAKARGLVAAPFDGSWERWGIAGHALESAEYEKARNHLVKRVSALSMARRAAARA